MRTNTRPDGAFVYTLLDGAGLPVYVGRSVNPAARIASHASEAKRLPEKEWVFDVRSLNMIGPFTWDEAVARERELIGRLQPRANIAMTVRETGIHSITFDGSPMFPARPQALAVAAAYLSA